MKKVLLEGLGLFKRNWWKILLMVLAWGLVKAGIEVDSCEKVSELTNQIVIFSMSLVANLIGWIK